MEIHLRNGRGKNEKKRETEMKRTVDSSVLGLDHHSQDFTLYFSKITKKKGNSRLFILHRGP